MLIKPCNMIFMPKNTTPKTYESQFKTRRNNNFNKKEKKLPVGRFLNFFGRRKEWILFPPIETRSHFFLKIKNKITNSEIEK